MPSQKLIQQDCVLSSSRILIHMLQSAMNCLDEYVEIVDRDEIIRFSTVGRLDGLPIESFLGKKFFDIYKLDPNSSPMWRTLTTKKQQSSPDVVDYQTLFNQKKFSVYAETYPIWLKGEFLGAVNILRDKKALNALERLVINWQGKRNNHFNSTTNYRLSCFEDIVGSAPAFKAIINQAQKAAASSFPVLLIGETGTGKDLLAQSIHTHHFHPRRPFVTVNCAAIPESLMESTLFGTTKGAYTGATERPGLFEEANGGTIFLDEINSMPLTSQPKLLCVLQNKMVRRVGSNHQIMVDVRIISAMNECPLKAMDNGSLRPDLYYRLASIMLEIPPLRDHKDDIPPLSEHFINSLKLQTCKTVNSFAPKVLSFFKKYTWPGNVRELGHVIEHAMHMVEENTPQILMKHLPIYLQKIGSECEMKAEEKNNFVAKTNDLPNMLKDMEKQAIIHALNLHNSNISKTARQLSISRQNLYSRIKRLNIKCEATAR